MFNNTNKILDSLCYLSILFLPVLFPLIVWVICSDNVDVSQHARNAFFLHLVPTILAVGIFFAIIFMGIHPAIQFRSWLIVAFIGCVIIIDVILFIYNIVKGIKCLL